VAGAFHTSFMEPAVSRLEAALAATEITKPRIPVISNVDAQPHSDPDTIKKILACQVSYACHEISHGSNKPVLLEFFTVVLFKNR